MPLSPPKRFCFALACLCLWAVSPARGIAPPSGVVGQAGDQSVILHWGPGSEAGCEGYRVYRSMKGAEGPFHLLNATPVRSPGFCDLSGAINGRTNFYYVTAVDGNARESGPSEKVAAMPRAFANDDEFLEYAQRANFDYFWYLGNPENGLVPDRTADSSPCSIAAVGFGLTALGIGADHGWITREQASGRTLTTLKTFLFGPQGESREGVMGNHGWFYHFLDMREGTRASGCELSTIDTALFLAGALYARQYFNGPGATEALIRADADALLNRVDWQFMSQQNGALSLAWRPESGFADYGQWSGYNEAMILYCLGLGAANHPLPASAWSVWTNGYSWGSEYGQSYLTFAPLFGHTYSHCWIDFRNIADGYMNARGCTYFENSRRATLAQVAYCSSAPHAGYGANMWGLTACDGPDGYRARGLPPEATDDGTIAPTGAGGVIPFAPAKAIAALRAMYDRYRAELWTAYGFRDAFNPERNWFDSDELGIDQGPIVVMIENYRTQRVWRLFMQNAVVQRGLERAGFVGAPTMAAAGVGLISTQ